jgi:hypothetical protein
MDSSDIRVEIYYLSNEPQKAIYGASYTPLVNANTQAMIDQTANKIGAAQTAPDGTVTLIHETGETMVTDFSRKTKVGDATSATVHCNMYFTAYPGCPAGSTVQMTFTLKGIAPL